MENIAIVTDSTSDLSQSAASERGITVIPLYVTHKGSAYRDGIDITPEQFYPLLEGSTELPMTSQPTPQQFKDIYGNLLQSAKEVISIHISQGLSSTFATARSVAEEFFRDKVHVVDSTFLSYGLAFQALEAARLVRENRTVQDILERLSRLRSKTELMFTLETLHYLQKGGRIGKVSAVVGNILGVKPVVRMEGGVYVTAEKARSMKRALQGMAAFLSEKYGRQKVKVAIGHGKGPQYAAMLRELVLSTLRVVGEPAAFHVGPVIGVHTGPGTIGLAVRPTEY